MTIARTASDVVGEHVTLEIECIDRMYLNLYVPQLQRDLGVVGFFKGHRGLPFASGAVMTPMTREFVAAIHAYVAEHGLDLVHFRKGQRKDEVAAEYLARFDGKEGICFVGRAQEKTTTWRTEKRRNPETGATYPWLVRATAMVNHFYFYGLDRDFGPFFVKFASYFPYNAKIYFNAHEWAKRQAAKARIRFEALDNGFASCTDAKALQKVCDRLSAAKIEVFARKWLRILPNPFTAADRRAGFGYDISILQAEFSLTQVLDAPLAGRVFFEDVIRHNLDLGRPDQVSLIFDRRIVRRGHHATPGRFRTRVITDGVTPSLHVDYKHSTIKQYHKLGRALRTETTINNTRDFDIGKRLHNLAALRQVGFKANRRLLGVQRTSHDPMIGAERLARLSAPVLQGGVRKTAGLRFGDDRVHALLGCMLKHRLHADGFTNAGLRALIAEATGRHPSQITAHQMSYDLRRLRIHGLIERVPGRFRYQLTPDGLAIGVAYTLAHDRIIRTELSLLFDTVISSDLRRAFDKFAARSCLAA
ncbi:MAG: hypothetical protein ACREJ4_07860 [Candidatus Methylomirabilaceae bacterium]